MDVMSNNSLSLKFISTDPDGLKVMTGMQRAFDWCLKLWLKFGTHRTSFRHFWIQRTNNFGVLPTCSHALQCNNLRVTLNVKYRQGPSVGAAPRSHKRHAESQKIRSISKS